MTVADEAAVVEDAFARIAPSGPAPLLTVRDLVVEFDTEDGPARAVDGVDLDVMPGEIVAVVGESGSGKSVTAMSILGLLPPNSARVERGSVHFQGRDVLRMAPDDLRSLRGGQIAMIFQDPMTALNPLQTVGTQIAEALRLHNDIGRRAAMDRAVELLAMVGVGQPEVRCREYPHQFSGGMRQRVTIAMAIANKPALLIADEPTTALDVTIQAQILDLLRDAQQETGAATILITHDLGVVAQTAARVVVMYAGRVVEKADVLGLFMEPRHPYTLGLLRSVPRADERDQDLTAIPGSPPSLLGREEGCPFAPRCEISNGRSICHTERPPLVDLSPTRATACHFHAELARTDGSDHG